MTASSSTAHMLPKTCTQRCRRSTCQYPPRNPTPHFSILTNPYKRAMNPLFFFLIFVFFVFFFLLPLLPQHFLCCRRGTKIASGNLIKNYSFENNCYRRGDGATTSHTNFTFCGHHRGGGLNSSTSVHIFLNFCWETINPLPPTDTVRKQKKIIQRIFSDQYSHSLKNITPLET